MSSVRTCQHDAVCIGARPNTYHSTISSQPVPLKPGNLKLPGQRGTTACPDCRRPMFKDDGKVDTNTLSSEKRESKQQSPERPVHLHQVACCMIPLCLWHVTFLSVYSSATSACSLSSTPKLMSAVQGPPCCLQAPMQQLPTSLDCNGCKNMNRNSRHK